MTDIRNGELYDGIKQLIKYMKRHYKKKIKRGDFERKEK
jgi:hypothetical protein